MARLMAGHDRLRELTASIRQALAAGSTTGAEAHLQELLLILGPHVRWEESQLFPRARAHDELAGHVDGLAGEHAVLYDDVDTLDELGDADDWCRGLLCILEDLGEHMYREDFGLFPAALATLDGTDWDDMDEDSGATLPVVSSRAPVPDW